MKKCGLFMLKGGSLLTRYEERVAGYGVEKLFCFVSSVEQDALGGLVLNCLNAFRSDVKEDSPEEFRTCQRLLLQAAGVKSWGQLAKSSKVFSIYQGNQFVKIVPCVLRDGLVEQGDLAHSIASADSDLRDEIQN